MIRLLRRRLSIERATLGQVGSELGLSRHAVWRLARKHGIGRPSRLESLARANARPEVRAKKRAHCARLRSDPGYCARRDRIIAAIARANPGDPRWLRKTRAALARRNGDPAFRAATLANFAAANRDPVVARRRRARLNGLAADVPCWVPDDLVVDFIDLALAFGEEAAALRVRRLKAEAQA